jgi:hypothetical protein
MATKSTEPAARATANDSMPEWIRLTAAYWTFPIAKNDCELSMIERELDKYFDRYRPSNEELCDAIRWLAGPDNKQAKCPTLRELIRAICILRKDRRENAQGQQQGQDVMSDVKAAMLRATTWLQRWDIMCDAKSMIGASRNLDNREQDAVYDWACQRWRDADDQFYAIRCRFAREIREAINGFAKRVST